MSERERRVLVVDDDVSIRGFLAEALTDEGYSVRTASNGREALSILESWRPALILLDLMMPEMDGWEFRVQQRARAAVADVPVVVLSATRDLAAKAHVLEAAQVFPKPFDLDTLLGTISRITAAAPGSTVGPSGPS
jgi:DNA-binding response OmpR family regulator